jgi:hypothetical protein
MGLYMDTCPRHGEGAGSPVYFSFTCNREIYFYIRQSYIPQLLHRLTEEYNVYSSVMNVCLSVITDECSCVFCSEVINNLDIEISSTNLSSMININLQCHCL